MRWWRLISLNLVLALGGCVTDGGTARWATAPGETVGPAGARHRVAWLKIDGGYDLRSNYNEALGAHDALTDKVRAEQAMMTMAQKLCVAAPKAVSSVKEGGHLSGASLVQGEGLTGSMELCG